MNKQPRRRYGLVLVVLWTVFTVSLVSWWIYFGISQIQQILAVSGVGATAQELHRFERMLFWEGLTMIGCLIGAGSVLFYYLRRQAAEAKKVKEFFAAFTHEIKTPIAGARLNLEVLEEKIDRAVAGMGINAQPLQNSVQRVLIDLDRLTLHIENSLFLSDESIKAPILESTHLDALLKKVASHFPMLDVVNTASDQAVLADKRILESIVTNIFNNAVVHGKATRITIAGRTVDRTGNAVLVFHDNGIGFAGNVRKLTVPFERHYSGSGSGIGLYLIRTLIERIKGKVSFPTVPEGFAVQIEVPHA